MHISNQHEKKPCSYCGEMFGENRMARHILSKHSSNADRPYKCNFCAKGFISKNRLKEHTNIHTGEKPFMCNFCGATFANPGNCRMHERTVHLGHNRSNSNKANVETLYKSLSGNKPIALEHEEGR